LGICDGGLQPAGRVRSRFHDGLGQILRLDQFGIAEHHGALDGILQFANVSRPMVEPEATLSPRGESYDAAAAARRSTLQKIACKRQDILGPFAERRYAERDHVEPMGKVLAKASLANLGG